MTLEDPGPQVCQQAPPQQYIPQQQYLPPGADNVGREDSACQKQFNPGDETYRCIDCEITDDTPGIEIYFLPKTKSQAHIMSQLIVISCSF